MKEFEKELLRAIPMAREIIKSRIQPGDMAVDATVGNGHDTYFLAAEVGVSGQVIGCDIQEEAIVSTRNRVADFDHVFLYQEGHENLDKLIPKGASPKVAMFNLGYLPRADKSVITRSETTIRALEILTECLENGGVITIVLYTGHEGGSEESNDVAKWCSALPQEEFAVIQYRLLNQVNTPPSLIAIEKKRKDG